MVLSMIEQVWNERHLDRVPEFFHRDLFLDTVGDVTITRPDGYQRDLLTLLSAFPSARLRGARHPDQPLRALRRSPGRRALEAVRRLRRQGALRASDRSARGPDGRLAVPRPGRPHRPGEAHLRRDRPARPAQQHPRVPATSSTSTSTDLPLQTPHPSPRLHPAVPIAGLTARKRATPMTDAPNVSPDEVARRTILRTDWVPCKAAFIDCRTPGSDRKDNYSFIGMGVSQSADQFVNLVEPHGFNVGAAGMPQGTVNSLHMHFTAEVFINFGGDYQARWGARGDQGEYHSVDGDVISVPTWVFRGFTNIGADDGILLTVLGQDDNGGIIWGPEVLEDAADQAAPHCRQPPHRHRGGRRGSRRRRPHQADAPGGDRPTRRGLARAVPRSASSRPPSAAGCPGRSCAPTSRAGERRQACHRPRHGRGPAGRTAISNPHSFDLASLRAVPARACRHRAEEPTVLVVKAGRWAVTVGAPETAPRRARPPGRVVRPPGAWRALTLLAPRGGGHDGGHRRDHRRHRR